MQGLMVHTEDGRKTNDSGMVLTFEDVAAVPLPEATDTYTPVGNGDLIRLIEDRAKAVLKVEPENLQLGLSRKDQQMFGVMTLGTGDAEKSPVFGFRNSYDKTLPVGLCSGSQVFVCDNLCFVGSSYMQMRRHSSHVWQDLQPMIDEALVSVQDVFEQFQKQTQAMKDQEVTLDQGFSHIGIARGRGLITPRQESVAIQDWITPRHEEFSDRNAWSLYNCFTEGLKKGSAGGSISRHTVIHDFFSDRFDLKIH